MRVASVLAGCVLAAWVSAQPPAAPQGPAGDGIDRLIAALQTAIQAGDPDAVRALTTSATEPGPLTEFSLIMTAPRVSSVTVKERDRADMPGGHQRLVVEILTDRDRSGVVSTWRLEVAPPAADAAGGAWRIVQIEKLTLLSGLYRLALDTTREFTVTNLVFQEPDLTLRLPAGHAFTANTPDGATAIVLLGRGTVEFAPRPQSERGQVHTFCGANVLNTRFDSVFLRLNPSEYASRIPPAAMTPRAVDRKDLRKAAELFESSVPLSFQIDVGDLGRERWSLLPPGTDAIAEIDTKRFGSLTYARAESEPEDISFFDRRHRKNIAVYASEAKLAARGRFFSDDDSADYDVTHYDVQASFSPDRLWLEGRTRLTFRTKSLNGGTMTLRLADPLVVRSVTSPRYGRLLHLRVSRQNSILVSFPTAIPSSADLVLDIAYGGRLPPQPLESETATLTQDQLAQEPLKIPVEPQYVYSNRSFWYPQGQTTDYATARMAIDVPSEYDVVASGAPDPAASGPLATDRGRKRFVFDTRRPARYLACIISRFNGTETAQLNLPVAEDARAKRPARASAADGGGAEPSDPPFNLIVQSTPHLANRTRDVAEKAADVLRFYTSLLADAPYGSFTVAMTESELPGGHSPAYFAIVNQPLPTSPFTWQNDPVAFRNYPSFFLAHEIAHQWWGQAVGWKNYHEQWLSEGFAQYFAALYAERERGPDQFTSIIRQMRKTAMDMSDKGPVYLGYRLGHLKGDSRIFRALVYNKGAVVLHMLRRLIGDRAFFEGIREFYDTWRYQKAGTDDFRVSMERASGQPLDRFFERWIYADALPELRFSSHVADGTLHVAFEQKTAELFDVPVTVTITYADGTSQDVIVPVTDRKTERTIPLKGRVRDVDVNRDGAALADIRK